MGTGAGRSAGGTRHARTRCDQALEALDGDREFLKAGGVMGDDFIDACIELKMGEVTRFRAATHPLEYGMYYGI